MEKLKVPPYFRFIIPIIDILKELGGSGRAGEFTDRVIEKLNLSEEELSKTIKSGASRIKNQIQWARFMLVQGGYLDSSQHGVWTLTEKGLKAELSEQDLLKLYDLKKQLEKKYKQAKSEIGEETESKLVHDETYDDEEYTGVTNHRTEVLNLLQSLPAPGFERICQRLLRESGFEQVHVTGKSGDGGIDGIGLLQVNPFVSFKVLFQCKRYQGTVSPSQVRDFRGAMQGRADKGIIMTTGTFTTEAKKEARRDGVPPIDLVDGDKLIEMFELLELGLKPRKTYDVDRKFFEEFMS